MKFDSEYRKTLKNIGIKGKDMARGSKEDELRMEKQKKFPRHGFWVLALALLVLFCTLANAEVTDSQAIRAIVGEAANQGDEGMLAVACAIRNRGTLKGVYGAKSKLPDSEPDWVWEKAKKAWFNSAVKDVVNGATHWENNKAFGKPYWADSMKIVKVVKDHVFYKEK